LEEVRGKKTKRFEEKKKKKFFLRNFGGTSTKIAMDALGINYVTHDRVQKRQKNF